MKSIVIIVSLCFMNLFAQAQSTTTPPDTIQLKQYTGTYKFAETFEKCVVIMKEGAIWAEVDANGLNKLIPLKETDKFQSTSSYGTIFTFRRDERKIVKSVKLELLGQEIEGQKDL